MTDGFCEGVHCWLLLSFFFFILLIAGCPVFVTQEQVAAILLHSSSA